MANVIVVAVVIVLLGFALKGTLKHLKGESPCCGGGDTIIIEDKKLDGPVIGKKTVKISGMHCDHCVRAVTEAINKIDGASAKVNLKKKEAVVSYEKVVEDAAIREAVEKAGYTVRSALFFIHDNRVLAERAFYCFNEGSADFDLQIFRGGKLRFEIQEVSKEGYAL